MPCTGSKLFVWGGAKQPPSPQKKKIHPFPCIRPSWCDWTTSSSLVSVPELHLGEFQFFLSEPPDTIRKWRPLGLAYMVSLTNLGLQFLLCRHLGRLATCPPTFYFLLTWAAGGQRNMELPGHGLVASAFNMNIHNLWSLRGSVWCTRYWTSSLNGLKSWWKSTCETK